MVYKFWYAMKLGDTQEEIDKQVMRSLFPITNAFIRSEVDSEDVYYAYLNEVNFDCLREFGYEFSDDIVVFSGDMDEIAPKETLRVLGLL